MVWLGVEPQVATQWEREQAWPWGPQRATSQWLAADPDLQCPGRKGQLPPGPLALHLDVDVLDFIDAPRAENTDGLKTPDLPSTRSPRRSRRRPEIGGW